LRFRLEAGEAFLRVEAIVDWHEENTLLKLHFPTAYRGVNARFGAPFGSVLRSQQPGRPEDEAQWETPGSRWAAVASEGERDGLALITEAKYGFLARDGDLSVSLLRSARVTGQAGDRYAVPEGLNRHIPTSPFSDQGRHVIRLVLAPYDLTGSRGAAPAALADAVFAEPLIYRGEPADAGLLGIEEAPTLIPAWSVPAGPASWLLRLHEVAGQRGKFRLRVAPNVIVQCCALDGSSPRAARDASDALLPFEPYEIITLRLTRYQVASPPVE
jgi:alpha-mannosidase